MSLFTIDDTRCKKDGLCAAACPMAIIAWQKDEIPVLVNGAEKMCINCGHCVAICPHAALSHAAMTPDQCPEIDEALAISPEQTEQFLRSRRSIRNFKQAPVERETMEKIIRLASYAPSGHNMQPVRWQVISGRDKVQSYAAMVVEWMKETLTEKPEFAKAMSLDLVIAAWDMGMDVITRNAPHLVLTNGPAKNPTSPAACTIAMTYFDLAAQGLGVGTCWCGYFYRAAVSHAPLQEALGLGKDINNFGAMMVGNPKFIYRRMPERNQPRITWTE